jgi:excisionase family DNA binding protein
MGERTFAMSEPAVSGWVLEPVGELGGPFVSVAEAAARMRVSKMTVYRLVHSGELPAVRFQQSFRVQRRAVLDLIDTAARQAES